MLKSNYSWGLLEAFLVRILQSTDGIKIVISGGVHIAESAKGKRGV